MEITLNDQLKTVTESSTLYDIVFAQLGEKQNGVAVALNNTVIPRANWKTKSLRSNDNILIIKATQGG
jgi:sulfur carrier protein